MLEQAYFISQITAAVFVVASILFLAVSVRQNSRLLQRTMSEDQRLANNALFERIATDRDFAEFHMKIGVDLDSLDDIDRYRARFLAQLNTRAVLHTIQAKKDGFVSDIEWRELCERVRVAGRRKIITVVWPQMKETYPKPLQNKFEELSGFATGEA
jgi:hypothetical protein